MRIAVPLESGVLATHFGHCREFALVDVDQETKTIQSNTTMEAPKHEPGLLPRWLSEKGASIVIAGGMGQRAKMLFAEHDITVLTGAPAKGPQEIVEEYLADSLETGDNACDH
jgi:predicted Fe-Mo cluster-binding NifX family protein